MTTTGIATKPRFVSAGELEAEEKDRQERMAAAQQAVVTDLAAYVQRCWAAAKKAKDPIAREMLKSQRMINGEYEPDKLAKIKAMGGSEIFMMLADEKCAAAKAWICDTILPPDDEPWGVESTPIPDLPDDYKQMIERQVVAEVEQDAAMGVMVTPAEMQERIDGIQSEIYSQMRQIVKETEMAVEAKIKDVIVESNWRQALEDCISDMVDYKAGFVKGPVFRQKKEVAWENGRLVPKTRVRIEFESPSAFDIYPSPSSTGINDGYLIEKHVLRRADIAAMKGVPGYNDEAIDAALKDYGQGGLREWLFEVSGEYARNRNAGRAHVMDDPEGTIDALQFWGRVQGLWLLEHGTDPERLGDLMDEYDVEVWLIGRHVIKCVINENPVGDRNYWKVSFRQRKGQFWGDGVVDLIRDIVDMCNAAARNLVNNMGIASGPQIGVDIDAMPPGEKLTSLTPNKIWQFSMKDVANGTRPPIWFFQPQVVIDQLIKVYEFFSTEADNKTGIPKYAYGQSGEGGAADTATGFSMMMNNASRNIKYVIRNMDDVVKGSIDAVHLHLMMTDNDPIWRRADVKAVARGTTALIAREQAQVRRNEFLSIALNSQEVLAMIGEEGLANILRPMASDLNLGRGDIVPPKEEIKRMAAMARMQTTGGQMGAAPAAGAGNQGGQPQQTMTPGAAPQVNAAGQVQGGQDAAIY